MGGAGGPIAELVRASGLRSVVAAPIKVEGRLWGAMAVGIMGHDHLPRETESRLGQFTELMATAVANAESRARADRLAREQAALRRVATLVAKEAPPGEVFAKVAEEAANGDRRRRLRAGPGRWQRIRHRPGQLGRWHAGHGSHRRELPGRR